MTYKQDNLLAMLDDVIAYLAVYHAIWDTNDTMTALVDAIEAKIDEIREKEGIQIISWKGTTTTKNKYWDIAADSTEQICEGLKSFYLSKKDATGFDNVNYPLSYFKYAKKELAVSRMKAVNTIATGITPITLLEDYHITTPILTAQLNAVTTFANSLEVKREKVIEKATATTNISEDFIELKDLVKQLDGMVHSMILTNKDFVTGYDKARIIIDHGKGHKTVKFILIKSKNFAQTFFEGKFKAGDSILIRNHGLEDIIAGLTGIMNTAPSTNAITIAANSQLLLLIPKDANIVSLPFISIVGQNKFADVKVTIILSKGVSKSKATKVTITGIPS